MTLADWRDVMEARHNADHARVALESFAGRAEESGVEHDSLAITLAGIAVVLELRSLSTMTDYLASRE